MMIGLLSLAAVAQAQLTIYMEALCPDTKRFFQTQLLPLSQEGSSPVRDIEIEFVPAGKMFGDEKEMSCQHGPSECKANIAMNCFLNSTQDKYRQQAVFLCFFKKNSEVQA
jgi:interferon gamma-inducible protein 30